MGSHYVNVLSIECVTFRLSCVCGKGRHAANPKQVEQVKEKPKTMGWFVGQVMKATGGKANPKAVNEIVTAKLGL